MSRASSRTPSRWSIANALTAFRLVVAAPLMLLLALNGRREWFLWVLLASFFSDFIDGTVARLTGQSSRFGAMLDSWADVTVYTVIAIAVWLMWPDVVRREWLPFAAIVASFSLPSLIGLAKFRRFTSYHTLLVKVAVAATAVGLVLLLWGGPAWPFRIAAAVALLAALEEIAITFILKEPHSNVRSIVSVWNARRNSGTTAGFQ
jgi:CDP-diacylglycerol--glycerol-3-phosphate 3-phosphatidyltransferase